MEKLTIRIVPTLGEKIRNASREKGLTLNAWMVQACWDALERWERVKEQQERKN